MSLDHAGASVSAATSLIVSADPDEQARSFGLLDQRYVQLSHGTFSGSVESLSFGSVTLFRETLRQSVHQAGCAPRDQVTIAAPCALSDDAHWNGRCIDAEAIIAFPPGREFELRSPRFAVCAGISIGGAELARLHAAEADGWASLLRRDTWACKAPSTGLGHQLGAVLDALSAEPGMLGEPAACAQLADELLGMISLHLRDACEPARAPRHEAYPRIARRARALMLERIDQNVRVQDLCDAIGCSRRALQYAFEHVFGVNPVSFLRALRLNAVRRELRRPVAETTVLDAAARQGFWHFSRFAQEYARMFGERPSETLAVARRAAMPGREDSNLRPLRPEWMV